MGIDLGRFKSKKNEEWLDWLADDPVPTSLRSRMRAQAVKEASRPVVRRPGQSPTTTQPSAPIQAHAVPKEATQKVGAHSVSIHISVPRLKKLSLPQKLPTLPRNLTYKQLAISMSALLVIALMGAITLHIRHNRMKNPETTGVLSAADQKPNFDTLTPGQSTKASSQKYDSVKKVASFTDVIGGVDITISQQPLPDALKKDTDAQVKKLAEGFSANEVLSTANPTAYLGTSVKGPQTVIFAKNNLLVFIQSTKKIDNHDWAEYITNLQ